MSQVPVEIKKSSDLAPTNQFSAFRQEMDRLIDRFWGGFNLPMQRRLAAATPEKAALGMFEMVVPAVDVTEDAAAFIVTAELPGMTENDVDVSMSNGMLTLKGEKRQHKEEHSKDFYLTERAFGSFERSFSLPDGVDDGKVSASFTNGVLTVTLPKKPEAAAATRKIEVKPGQ
jgi:HSP20 family protein